MLSPPRSTNLHTLQSFNRRSSSLLPFLNYSMIRLSPPLSSTTSLKNIYNTWIKKSSNVLSSRTAMELRGISCIDLEIQDSKRKSCVVSRSFGKKVETFQELKESVTNYCLNASEKIRSESLIAKSVTVFLRTSPFQNRGIYYSNSKTIDFPIATDNSIEIVKVAINGDRKSVV